MVAKTSFQVCAVRPRQGIYRIPHGISMILALFLFSLPSYGKTAQLGRASVGFEGSTEGFLLSSPAMFLEVERASSSMVGTIMALLATFDEAGVLPPEGTPEANHIIHGLIQLQSALVKSPSSELVAYQKAAVEFWMTHNLESKAPGVVGQEGLTDRLLAALIAYDQEYALWEEPTIVKAMQAFNVTHDDWLFIVKLFKRAEKVFHDQGSSIHEVFERWRTRMPGGKSELSLWNG